MKILLLAIVSLAASLSVADVHNLACGSGNMKIEIDGVRTNSLILKVHVTPAVTFNLPMSTTDDCKNRADFECYQTDEIMVNVPKTASDSIYVNFDTDDDDHNDGLGESYSCSEI